MPTQLITQEEVLDEKRPAEDLLALEGMTKAIAYQLAERGIRTQEDLAELAVDEMDGIEDVTEESAASLIMLARAPLFEESAEE